MPRDPSLPRLTDTSDRLRASLGYSGGVNSAVQPPAPGRRPTPPGRFALRIDPAKAALAAEALPASRLPIVDETSAGGLVISIRDGEPHAAVIARRNRAGRLEWCLPKGHLEGDETPQEAAVREVAEETGIIGVIRATVGIIDYWFAGDGHRVHKVVHHFLLEATGGFLTVDNDPDHEAEDVAWVRVADLATRLTYPNERRLASSAGDVMHRIDPTIFEVPGP